MEHARLRGAHRSNAEFDQVDLGNEPPLSVDGESVLVDRRRVSVQWFSATILTGLCGAALMGGAVYASLDGESTFAAMPERFESALRGPLGGERTAASTRKGDRLPAASELTARRQVIRVSTTSRVGNREVVRVRPFVRVNGNLALTLSELSAGVPAFNPQKLLTDTGPQGAAPTDEAPGAAPDAEVSFVTRDLAAALPRAKVAALLPIDDVLNRVREAASWTGNAGTPSAGPALASASAGGPGFKLSYANEGEPDPYAGFEPRIVPENITLLPKTNPQGGNNAGERVVLAKKNDSIGAILRELLASPDEIKGLTTALGQRGRDGVLKEGQRIRVLLAPATAMGHRLAPVRVTIVGDAGIEAVVALSDLGKYVSVDVSQQNQSTEVAEVADDEEDDGSGVRLYQSIYETGFRQQIPRGVIDDMIRIYSYDVDFQRKTQTGDTFEVLFAGDDENANNDRNEVLFASITVGGETKKFYRFQSTDDGLVDYYDETGKSAKKFLVRKPLMAGIMRSSFGSRNHPILGYTKMHTGVDWAAPHGTQIFASGNGTIEKVGWEGGYGKYIRVRHANGYETAYGHMTAFARGIEPGTKVRQGQVIGYVGSTGLSTGAHLHYEILVNGRFVDPMRIRLPRGRVLDGPVLDNFAQERERLDSMMAGRPTRVATSSR